MCNARYKQRQVNAIESISKLFREMDSNWLIFDRWNSINFQEIKLKHRWLKNIETHNLFNKNISIAS